MAQPTPYVPAYSFTQFQESHPNDPLPADQVDSEFFAIKVTLDQTLTNLALIQRDDGALKNNVVTPESLSSSTLALMGDYTIRGAWLTATAYVVKDVVVDTANNISYVCAVAHTSGTLATDVAAGKWVILGSASGLAAYFTPTGLSLPPTGLGMFLAAANTIGFASNTATVLRLVNPSSAVNYLVGRGSATGNNVSLEVSGTDANISLDIKPSATSSGKVNLWANGAIGFSVGFFSGSPAVNYIGVNNCGTGFFPIIHNTSSSDANPSMIYLTKGSGEHIFNTGGPSGTNGVTQVFISHTASAVNYMSLAGATTGNSPLVRVNGSDANVGLRLRTKGSGALEFQSEDAITQFRVVRTVFSAVNHVSITGAATGNPPVIHNTDSSDANVSLLHLTKGTGNHVFSTGGSGVSGTIQVYVAHKASAVNQLSVNGGIASNPVEINAVGSDTNIDIMLTPKGTGLIRPAGSSFLANGAVAVTLTSLGPTGAATTVQKWLRVSDAGTTRYIPCW